MTRENGPCLVNNGKKSSFELTCLSRFPTCPRFGDLEAARAGPNNRAQTQRLKMDERILWPGLAWF